MQHGLIQQSGAQAATTSLPNLTRFHVGRFIHFRPGNCMIKEPRYEPKIKKWIVEYGDRAHYFADGETAEDFYLINRARYNETKNP